MTTSIKNNLISMASGEKAILQSRILSESVCAHDIINLLALETSRYAQQKLSKSKLIPCSQMHKWTPTNPNEIKKFLGLIL